MFAHDKFSLRRGRYVNVRRTDGFHFAAASREQIANSLGVGRQLQAMLEPGSFLRVWQLLRALGIPKPHFRLAFEPQVHAAGVTITDNDFLGGDQFPVGEELFDRGHDPLLQILGDRLAQEVSLDRVVDARAQIGCGSGLLVLLFLDV